MLLVLWWHLHGIDERKICFWTKSLLREKILREERKYVCMILLHLLVWWWWVMLFCWWNESGWWWQWESKIVWCEFACFYQSFIRVCSVNSSSSVSGLLSWCVHSGNCYRFMAATVIITTTYYICVCVCPSPAYLLLPKNGRKVSFTLPWKYCNIIIIIDCYTYYVCACVYLCVITYVSLYFLPIWIKKQCVYYFSLS